MCSDLSSETWVLGPHKICLKMFLGLQVLAFSSCRSCSSPWVCLCCPVFIYYLISKFLGFVYVYVCLFLFFIFYFVSFSFFLFLFVFCFNLSIFYLLILLELVFATSIYFKIFVVKELVCSTGVCLPGFFLEISVYCTNFKSKFPLIKWGFPQCQ